MNQFDQHNAERHARELGACLRDAAQENANVEQMAGEADRLRRAVAQVSRGACAQGSLCRGGALVLAALAAIMLVVGTGIWTWRVSHAAPLAFDVVGPGRVSATCVASPPGASTLLKFSDGSTVLAQGGARLRVPELHTDGATLMLDSGKATVHVLHRHANTRWTVVAGPFAIAVVGTRFDVEWVPNIERLSIDMIEGQVEVGGPKFPSSATVRAGQHIEASSDDARWMVTPLLEPNAQVAKPDAQRVEAGTDLPSVPKRERANHIARGTDVSPTRGAASSPRGRSATSAVSAADASLREQSALEPGVPSWSKLIARGDSQRVIAEADAMGQKSCFGQCGSADLRALADAARYSGRLDLAEASLRALRDRFPAQAGVAAYLLGAVDEARGRNASALRWYQEYISAAPAGGFLSEALAGRLRMLVATNGHTSARKAAREYLELYPNGVGARTANQVLQRR